jgi:hypothetical protein
MKRFLLFGFPEYYPGGGASDLIGDFDTFEEAVAHMNGDVKDLGGGFTRPNQDHYHILDTDTGDVTDF